MTQSPIYQESLFSFSSKENLSSFIKQLKGCKECEHRFGFEPHPIQWGASDAKVLVISQAPGLRVHETGKPFYDLSGKKLRQQWFCLSEEQFYDPHLFYFTMVGHCFPGRNKNNTDKKPPKICWNKWTRQEINLLPTVKLIIVIGSEAASRMFPKQKLDSLVFDELTWQQKPCFVLPHPSPLNFRWIQNHPEFERQVLPKLRQELAQALNLSETRIIPAQKPFKESWEN